MSELSGSYDRLTDEQKKLVDAVNSPELLAKIKELQEQLRAELQVIRSQFFQGLVVCGRGSDENVKAVREAVAIDMEIQVKLAADDFWNKVQAAIREVCPKEHDR